MIANKTSLNLNNVHSALFISILHDLPDFKENRHTYNRLAKKASVEKSVK
jgi:hypothetical protein